MSDYSEFVTRKLANKVPSGIAGGFSLPATMFPHQSALTSWALRRGRAAIFADTGLGKMRMELAWAAAVHKHTRRPVMIHTPLAVAAQLATEGAKVGIHAQVCREAADLIDGINITNYDRRHKQLEVIRRGVSLWSNPGDTVLSPFMGIGSEGFVALELGRRFVGAELKASYFKQAVANLAAAIQHKDGGLFDAAEAA